MPTKKVIAVSLTLILLMLVPATTASAASKTVRITDMWTTVASVPDNMPTGLNKYVTIDMENFSTGHVNDARMLGNTSVVWQEDSAIYCNGQRTFWCGPDVYVLMVKVRSVGPIGNLHAEVGNATVSW